MKMKKEVSQVHLHLTDSLFFCAFLFTGSLSMLFNKKVLVGDVCDIFGIQTVIYFHHSPPKKTFFGFYLHFYSEGE